MNRQDLNTLLAVVLPILFASIVGFVVWKFQSRITAKALEKIEREKERRQKLANEHQILLDRVSALEKQGTSDSQTLALLKQEMLPMAEAMKRKLVEILTHPSDAFILPDALLAKVKDNKQTLTDTEKAALDALLEERATSTNPHVTEQEKLAAKALPIIIELAELEAREADGAAITEVQLVSSTSKSPETKKQEEGGRQ